MLPERLVLATHNPGKLAEWRALLTEVQGLSDAVDLGLPEPAEDADSFLANALAKALHCESATQRPSLAEDSGLLVHALDGEPGVHTRRFADRCGGWPQAARRLLGQVGAERAAATYVCAIALAWPDGRWIVAQGEVRGYLVPPRGVGPGLACAFLPAGQQLTWAELGAPWRAANDHRAQAFKELLRQLGDGAAQR